MKPASATIEKMLEQIATLVPGTAAARDELRALLSASFNGMVTRMNLVSREEFDAQAALLARARDKLDALEARLATLEAESADDGR
ncbi:MAG: accessory factor UbiK family protein [Gammaproteobacteria bacterium]|nr:accessory factor UbiK family protein [Gammaproteobacteria bacterium]